MIRIPVVTLNMVLAPSLSPHFTQYIVEHYLIPKYTSNINNEREKKKIEKTLRSLDRVFVRTIYPLDTNIIKPALLGRTVYGAIKKALNMGGLPLNYPTIYGIFFDEKDVVYNTVIITLPNPKSNKETTLLTTELIVPNATGELILEELPDKKYRPPIIQVGCGAKYGYGLIRIRWPT